MGVHVLYLCLINGVLIGKHATSPLDHGTVPLNIYLYLDRFVEILS